MNDPTPNHRAEAIAVAKRQLVLLEELVAMEMVVARATAHAVVAAAHAVEVILADELWQPETGRARALAGEKDAAEAHQKAMRSLRLTLVLQKTVVEDLCDFRAGIPGKTREATARHPFQLTKDDVVEATAAPIDRVEAEADRATALAEHAGSNAERLYEFDRPDRFGAAGFKTIVNGVCADIGVAVDWQTWAINTRALDFNPVAPKPADWSETKPPPRLPTRQGVHPPPPKSVPLALTECKARNTSPKGRGRGPTRSVGRVRGYGIAERGVQP